MNNSKKWGISFIAISLICLCIFGAFTVVIDPYFHYHEPLGSLEYPIDNERYQNDGIVRNFKYNAIITGTSMTQNFKTSECDAIFGVNSIKVPFSGASFKEVNENLKRALSANSEVKLVIRGIDGGMLKEDKDLMRYKSYPTYLTDENLFNDVNYLLNKEVLIKNTYGVLKYTRQGKITTNFDEYMNWTEKRTFGKNAVLAKYNRLEKQEKKHDFVTEFKQTTYENLYQNVIEITKQYPEVEFYYFFPPSSIYHFDSLNQNGTMEMYIDMYKFATELMLEQENIHVFSFFNEYDIITNLDNYSDVTHYHERINTKMLQWMGNGENQLTKENYKKYWDEVYNYYSRYDYESIF